MNERPPTLWELAIEATASTRQGYNLLAPYFNQTLYATPVEMIDNCRDRVDFLFPAPKDARGADLACGTGRATLALLASCSKVEGYDFSRFMLEEAQNAALKAGVTSCVSWFESDLAVLRLDPSCYDRITMFGAWGHILPPWRGKLMRSIAAALKPGGVFYTVTADPMTRLSMLWWRAALFDTVMTLRNRLLQQPFHMYYLLNNTLEVRDLLQGVGGLKTRLEPIPRKPHRALTLLMAYKPETGLRT